MKAFVASLVALVVISVIAGVVLTQLNPTAAEATRSLQGATRL